MRNYERFQRFSQEPITKKLIVGCLDQNKPEEDEKEFTSNSINKIVDTETSDLNSRKAQFENTQTSIATQSVQAHREKDEAVKSEKERPPPLRLQENYKKRKLYEYKERAQALKNNEHFVIRENKPAVIKIKNSVKIPAEKMMLVEVEPFQNIKEFIMVTPNEKFLHHKELEVLDGSYYHTCGGYVLVQNRSENEVVIIWAFFS